MAGNDNNQTVQASEEQKYFRQEFIDNSEALFGVPRQAVIGALCENPAEELTVSEVRLAVKEFMGRKVK